jgi:hypothetical protein
MSDPNDSAELGRARLLIERLVGRELAWIPHAATSGVMAARSAGAGSVNRS